MIATQTTVRQTDAFGRSETIDFDTAVERIVAWLARIGCHREANREHVAAALRRHPVKGDGFFWEAIHG